MSFSHETHSDRCPGVSSQWVRLHGDRNQAPITYTGDSQRFRDRDVVCPDMALTLLPVSSPIFPRPDRSSIAWLEAFSHSNLHTPILPSRLLGKQTTIRTGTLHDRNGDNSMVEPGGYLCF